MRQSKETDVWSVLIREAHGDAPATVYRVTRAAAERVVIDYLFDTDGGIGMGGTASPDEYPRICVWNEQ